MRRIEKLVKTFVEKCYENDFELFLSPEVEALKDLSKLEKDWIFFQARNGELFKLRNDYTASIVEYFNKLQLERFRVWYTGFVYRYDHSGEVRPKFQLGVEIIPFSSLKDLELVLQLLIETVLSSLTDRLLVEIGDSRVIEKCVQHVPRKFRKQLFELIDRKDVSEIEFFASLHGLDLSNVVKLVENSFTKRGVDGLKDFPLDSTIEAEIVRTVDFLSKFSHITVELDFSIARTIEEYDGPTFTMFDLKNSLLIAAGGRYKVNENVLAVGGTIFLEERTWSN
ncbi:ATP phosphoribosyltransferase regulatory subunit [Pseudothermotoga sp.]|nr:ATP phosphoribosyltransferase regulatory subunit [Pseudothermotoga sp.]MDW8140522.1 ATP phosphoribosyltransferase regulatory subunit [Pseudothermotoga sp.]